MSMFDQEAIEAAAKAMDVNLMARGERNKGSAIEATLAAAEASLRERGKLVYGGVSVSKSGIWTAYEGSGNTHQDFTVAIIRIDQEQKP